MAIRNFTGPYRFLSNFYLVSVRMEEHWYASVEHAYQAAKTSDPNERQQIMLARTPGIAKRLGKLVHRREDWEEVKLRIMAELLREKFRWPDMRLRLIDTGDAQLIEENNWGDTFWGVCRGKGENNLGKLLMAIRNDCK